jgi:putative NADPH-quinone reductase
MLIVHAHPRPSQSRVVKDLLSVLQARPGAEVRSLYQLYPDFDIDVEAEQQALLRAQHIVWLTPVYWYSVPALMKHWIDQVLAHGWAYGHGGEALKGKACWWVASAGGSRPEYTPEGTHKRPFADYVTPIENTARFCGMQWFRPFVVHGGHAIAPQALGDLCASLEQQCEAFEGVRAQGVTAS